MKTSFWRRLKASIETILRKREFEKWHKIGKLTALALEVLRQSPGFQTDGPFLPHPLYNDRVMEYRQNALYQEKNSITPFGVVAYAASLMDIPRAQFRSVPEKNNRAISGSWAHHMKAMINEMGKFQKQMTYLPNKAVRKISSYVIMGCFGNALLVGQSLEATVREANQALDAARKMHPGARMIVYGLPPSYNVWVRLVRFYFEAAMLEWVAKDQNAVYITLSGMGGFLGLFPSIELSSDAIHLTPKGVVRFDEAIDRAKRAAPRTIIRA